MPIERRDESPLPGGSTLTTSAPMSASTWPQNGPAITWVSSSTRSPSSAPAHAGTEAASSARARRVTPGSIGTPASRRPISTPHSVPASIRSLKSPRWPIRNTRPASLPEPRAERHVEALEDHSPHLVGVVAVGSTTRSASRSTRARRRHSTSRPHAATARARGGGVAGVAREHVLQPLLAQHRERLAQAVEQVGGRRVGPEALRGWRRGSAPSPSRSAAAARARTRRAPSRDTALKPRPAGSIRPFCEPPTVTSTPHSSWR